MVAEELRLNMAKLGLQRVDDMVGRADLLDTDDAITHWKAEGLDLTSILTAKIVYEGTEVFQTIKQNHGLDKALDKEIIRQALPAIENGDIVNIELPVINTNRVVGAMLSHEVAVATKGVLLPDDTINITLKGLLVKA